MDSDVSTVGGLDRYKICTTGGLVVSNFITNPIFVSGTMENAVSLVELIKVVVS